MLSRLRLALVAALVLVPFIPGPARADFAILKPDLKIGLLAPSSLGPLYCRVIINNSGPAAAGSCFLKLHVHNSANTVIYKSVPAIPAQSGVGFHVYLGVPFGKCGQWTSGQVDIFQQVNESNESNNTSGYVSPPC